jgi:hypothetical protein
MISKEFLNEGTELSDVFRKAKLKNEQGLKDLFDAGIKLVPITINPVTKKPVYIYDNSGRYTVVVNMGGFTVPFYVSTGLGGKETVEIDKWYPFFGIGEDGWINKSNEKEINNYYGSSKLRQVAQTLNSTLGKPMREMDNVFGWSGPVTKYGDKTKEFISVVNRGLEPVSNKPWTEESKQKFIKNASALLAKLGPKEEPKYEKDLPTTKNITPAPTSASIPTTEPVIGKLSLTHNKIKVNELNVSATLGRDNFKKLGDDSKFWDTNQFKLEKNKDNTWNLIPNINAINKTMINHREVTGPTIVRKGMIISVGNPKTGVEKLPLVVS